MTSEKENGSTAVAVPFDQTAEARPAFTPAQMADIERMKADLARQRWQDAQEAARRILDYWNVPAGRMPRAPHSQDEVLVAQTLLSLDDAEEMQEMTEDQRLEYLRRKAMGPRQNPPHPMFRDHNCAYCKSGEKPCRYGNPSQCGYPYARND